MISWRIIRRLSPAKRQRTSAAVPALFDMNLRSLRRDRAARTGPELFLHERAYEDCVERLTLMQWRFGRALLIGCPDPKWPARLLALVDNVEVRDPAHYSQAPQTARRLQRITGIRRSRITI